MHACKHILVHTEYIITMTMFLYLWTHNFCVEIYIQEKIIIYLFYLEMVGSSLLSNVYNMWYVYSIKW